jgi:hypothetical protein
VNSVKCFTNVIGLQPFTDIFPRADIHDLLSSDLLHQVIKGLFKDHFVAWICDYLILRYGQAAGEAIINVIDCQYVQLPYSVAEH